MATSGVIGTVKINTAKLIEKAIRRIGLTPQTTTPDIVDIAKEDLFMLLMSMSNRGINLWCVDKQLISLSPSRSGYDLPVGTLNVLNLLHATPSLATPDSNSSTATSYTEVFLETQSVTRFGVVFSTLPVAFSLETSDDGIAWTTQGTFTELPTVGARKWYDLDPKLTAFQFRISSTDPLVVSSVYWATAVRETAISQFNRDDYANQPNKRVESSVVTSYYFEKLVNPLIEVWPVPTTDTQHLVLFRHRQMEDVGSLTQELELPSRWLEAITWQLALRLAFEVPGVDPARRAEVNQMAQGMTAEVETGETDEAPIYFAPNIGVYTA